MYSRSVPVQCQRWRNKNRAYRCWPGIVPIPVLFLLSKQKYAWSWLGYYYPNNNIATIISTIIGTLWTNSTLFLEGGRIKVNLPPVPLLALNNAGNRLLKADKYRTLFEKLWLYRNFYLIAAFFRKLFKSRVNPDAYISISNSLRI